MLIRYVNLHPSQTLDKNYDFSHLQYTILKLRPFELVISKLHLVEKKKPSGTYRVNNIEEAKPFKEYIASKIFL